jgi:hypothetical protein
MRLQNQHKDAAMSEPPNEKWVTGAWIVDESHTPVEVGFIDLAAVYRLDRSHPCFPSWLALLKKSRDEKLSVVFDIGDAGIIYLEPADKLAGVVGEIFRGIEHTFVGFTIPEYAGIFLIPNDDPQLSNWLMLLHESKNNQRKIIFAYDAYRRRVTSLALAEH